MMALCFDKSLHCMAQWIVSWNPRQSQLTSAAMLATVVFKMTICAVEMLWRPAMFGVA